MSAAQAIDREVELEMLIAEQAKEMDRAYRGDSELSHQGGHRSVGKDRQVSLDRELADGGFTGHDLHGVEDAEPEAQTVTLTADSAYARHRKRSRSWDQASVVAAIRRWYETYGESPAMPDWQPKQARSRGTPNRAARYLAGDWPHAKTVVKHCETWNRALELAGVPLNSSGPKDTTLAKPSRLSRRNLDRLRAAPREAGSRVNGAVLAAAVAKVARLDEGDEGRLQEALLEVAAIAVAWADRIGR